MIGKKDLGPASSFGPRFSFVMMSSHTRRKKDDIVC